MLHSMVIKCPKHGPILFRRNIVKRARRPPLECSILVKILVLLSSSFWSHIGPVFSHTLGHFLVIHSTKFGSYIDPILGCTLTQNRVVLWAQNGVYFWHKKVGTFVHQVPKPPSRLPAAPKGRWLREMY